MNINIGDIVLVPGEVEDLFQGGKKSEPDERVMVRFGKFTSVVYKRPHVIANGAVQALIDAAEVLVRTEHIVDYLVKHDRKAMQQLLDALKGLPKKEGVT